MAQPQAFATESRTMPHAGVEGALSDLPGRAGKIRMPELFAMQIGVIIGTGWIVASSVWIRDAGPFGAIIAFGAGAAVMCLIGLCMGELVTSFPDGGGTVAYNYEAFGLKAAYAAGWLLIFSYITLVAFLIVMLGRLLQPFMGATSIIPWAYGAGAALAMVIAWVNIVGAQASARLQFWIVVGKLSMAVVLALLALRFGNSNNLMPGFAGQGTGSHLSGIALVLIGTPFWFTGFDVLPQALRDRDPRLKLSRIGSLIAGTIVVSFLFYAMVILACSALVPRASLLQMAVPSYQAFVAGSGSPALGSLVIVVGFFGILSAWNATVFAGARILRVMTDSRLLPSWVSGPSGKLTRPVLFFSGSSYCLSLIGTQGIEPFIVASSITLTVVLAMCCAAVLRLRVRCPDLPRPYRVPGGNATPLLGLVLAMGLVVMAALDPLTAAQWQLPLEWILVSIWIVMGIALWTITRVPRHSIPPATQRALLMTIEG